MAAQRKIHTAAFKAQVALAVVRGDRTVNELTAHFGVHPTLVRAWKKHLLAGAERVLAGGAKSAAPGGGQDPRAVRADRALQVELGWVENKAATLG